MNWRLLRKFDMGLLTLLKGAPILVQRQSNRGVESLVMYAFCAGLLKGPKRIVAMKLSKVGAWRTHIISRWLRMQGQKVTVECFN
jgi:hypothetical protein